MRGLVVPRLEISLLGAVQITVDGAPIEVDTRKAVALLAWLALSPGRHSRDVLAALLWPETDQARAALRRTLSTLHNALGQRWLAIERESVALIPEGAWIDVMEFRKRAGAGDSGTLERALELWRGDFMAGFSLRDSPEFDDWVVQQAENLRRDQAGVLERLVQQLCGQRQLEPAARYARRWLALDPLHEDAQRQLMRIYAWMGDRSAALHQYRECVRVLDAELGVPPLAETTALYELLLEQHELPLPEPSAPPAAMHETRQVTAAAPAPSPGIFPLVGRDDALETLQGAWSGSGVRGRLGILHGEAGIGKTRLAEALLAHAARLGAARISARCYEGETSLAFGPFVEGLREALATSRGRTAAASLPGHVLADVSRLLPELAAGRANLPPAAPLDGPGAQARFYGSVLELLGALLAGETPGILLLDDAQWLDAASLDLVSFIAHRLDRHPFLLLLAWRDDLVADDHRLRRLEVAVARNDAVTSLALERLTRDDVRELLAGVPGSDDGTLIERLFEETEGLPFFLTEYLRELPRHAGDDGVSWSIPSGMRDMLRQRLAAVTPIESQLLTTMATAGRACSIELLQEASGRRAEEALVAIEGLLARGLIVEQVSTAADGHTPQYAFSHEKMRELAYEDTSLARRRLVHRRIAEALLAQARGSGAQQAAPQAALHYRLAGAFNEAALQYRMAGDMARDLYASTDALAQYQMALAMGHPDAASIQTAIGDQYTLLGRYDEAFVAYETAAALSAGVYLGVIEGKLGNLHQRLGRWERAERHYEAAVGALSAGRSDTGAGDLAGLYAEWSLVARRRGDLEEALARARQSFELASAGHDERALARAHNLLGILARASGDLPEARAALDESLRIATRLGDDSGRIAALNNLALVHADLRDFERAIHLAHAALDACEAIGDRHREAALRSNLADCYHGAGRLAEAREQVAASARIYGEIGVVAGEPQPEVWKLTEW